MVNVSRSIIRKRKREEMLITESEREGTAQKEHSLKKCGRKCGRSVAATKSVAASSYFMCSDTNV